MAICPAPRKPDERLKDWWVENPWLIAAQGKSLSGYERNRIFINSRGREFFEVSGVLPPADSEGDGRSVVPLDFNGDGMTDFIVRQAGGGPFLLFENRFPKASWIRVSLRGSNGNSQGIGARVVAEAGPLKLTGELYPHNTFKAQAPADVRFGLGSATKIDKLTITWPGGSVQELRDVPANQHLRVTEPAAAK